jgi:hypothetical protein
MTEKEKEKAEGTGRKLSGTAKANDSSDSDCQDSIRDSSAFSQSFV